MAYEMVSMPFDRGFEELSRTELAQYASWFDEIRSSRVVQIERAIHATAGFEPWQNDGGEPSVRRLGEWFEQRVSMSPRQGLVHPMACMLLGDDLPKDDLSDDTLSVAFDLGVLIGELLIRAVPGSCWRQVLKGKRFIDYGRVVVWSREDARWEPILEMTNCAYAVARGDGAELVRRFEHWTTGLAG